MWIRIGTRIRSGMSCRIRIRVRVSITNRARFIDLSLGISILVCITSACVHRPGCYHR